MKLGVLTNVIGETPLKEALAYFKSLGAQMVELGCGGYPGKDHCDPSVLLHDEAKFQEFVDTAGPAAGAPPNQHLFRLSR